MSKIGVVVLFLFILVLSSCVDYYTEVTKLEGTLIKCESFQEKLKEMGAYDFSHTNSYCNGIIEFKYLGSRKFAYCKANNSSSSTLYFASISSLGSKSDSLIKLYNSDVHDSHLRTIQNFIEAYDVKSKPEQVHLNNSNGAFDDLKLLCK